MTDEELHEVIKRHATAMGKWLAFHYPDPATWGDRWVVEQSLRRIRVLLDEVGESVELDVPSAFAWGAAFQTMVLDAARREKNAAEKLRW